MIQAVLLVCVPLFVALVGHSLYRVRKANREHEARTGGIQAPVEAPPPTSTYTEW